jgi:uncharacterized protein (DUF1015 family)
MADVRPFRALKPRNDLAGEVIAPPYDVLTIDEARAIANNPRSFVHVTRSEVDLAPNADAHGKAAYAKARENLDGLCAEGVMLRDAEPRFYFYGQTMGEHSQVGILAACSVEEYDAGRIAKHEFTRPDKEDDRTHHMEVLDAQVGLVFLTYRARREIKEVTDAMTGVGADWEVTTEDGVRHTFWTAPQHMNAKISAAFHQVERLYIADGHHRSAAASRVHAVRGNDGTSRFLAGLFPDDELYVMAYNRLVRSLNGHTVEEFMAAVRERFEVSPGGPSPSAAGEVCMYLEGAWHLLVPRSVVDDPVGRLDVSVLQEQLLRPLLGIEDPRRSDNIGFAGGIRGTSYLSDAVDQGEAAVAFSLFPTSLAQLFDVADAGDVMPPKSTWFEPKLRGGVAVRLLR